ncbi:MAG TPA: NAD(P)/FAD-dependent oxidoreductase [Anaerolineae bacterium]|nr:NAD(P)/FAD-dependent oxidoreductase [Anaerolineae bacterium]
MSRVVVIGAGVGGLTSAALLARAGLDVTVLEAHIYAGGCASTFYHQGYRFDTGATLPAGFYPGGPMEIIGQAAGVDRWPVRTVDPAMVVHLPDGASVSRYADGARSEGPDRWEERRRAFGPEADAFWRWQESTSDALWDLAMRMPSWPPQTVGEAARLVADGLSWLGDDLGGRLSPGLALDAVRPVAYHLKGASERLRLFVDAQLLIASQTTSRYTNALYGASALDLPRRGVVHAEGGMGTIAETLVEAVRRNGGKVHFRQEATQIAMERGRPVAVETKKGGSFPADIVVVNLPPWNVARLLGEQAPRRLRSLPEKPQKVWGAFMVYAGLDSSAIPRNFALHHQVVVREPFGNGNTVFLSLSPAWDGTRAPEGRRALTMSTHTELEPWWELFQRDREAYKDRKQEYVARILSAAEVAMPGLGDAADLVLPGTPVTFQRFTRRLWGWVGGFPQTSLLRAWGPRLGPGLWMVGDSIFPGQSVPAVALGGMRVARSLLAELSPAGAPFKAPRGQQSAVPSISR